jgi:hypothetical protein
MMETLDTYGRTVHQCGKSMVLDPPSPAEVAAVTEIS